MFNWILVGLLSIVSFVVNRLLAPRVRAQKPGDFQGPTAQEGLAVPVFYGTCEISPNTAWFGDVQKKKITDSGAVFWKYYANMHNVLCWGVVNEVVDVLFDNHSARVHHLAHGGSPVLGASVVNDETHEPEPVFINGNQDPTDDDSPAMLGGQTQGGGVEGTINFYWGYDDQPANSLLTTKYGFAHRWPKFCYAVFGGASVGAGGFDLISCTPLFTSGGLINPSLTAAEVVIGPGTAFAHTFSATTTLTIPIGASGGGAPGVPGWAGSQAAVYISSAHTDTITYSVSGINPASFPSGSYRLYLITSGYNPYGGGYYVSASDRRPAGTSSGGTFLWDYNTPTPPQVRFVMRRTAWQESGTSPLGQTATQMTLENDANPAEIIYDLLTSTLYGLGLDASLIDTDSFSSCAQLLRTEVISATKTGLGLSVLVNSAEDAAKTIGDVLVHIDGVVAANPTTGKLKMKLMRGDYSIGDLLVVSTANASGLVFSRSSWRETVNEVRVKYQEFVNSTERIGFVDSAVLAQDLANRYATGSTRSVNIDMPFATHKDIAQLICQRQLRRMSYPLAKARWRMNRAGSTLAPGDVVNLTWSPLGISNLAVRITEIDYGTLDDPEMEVSGTEDIFNVASASYTSPPDSGWQNPPPIILTGYGYAYGYDYGGTGA